MDVMLVVIAILQAYVLGSLNFAVIFSKIFGKKGKNDVRNFGSGNAGMTNMVRVYGVLPGVLTFICDALKGFVACFIGKYVIFSYLSVHYSNVKWYVPIYGALLCGVFVMLGHVFPAFFGFKGGKGIAVSVGIFAVAHWQAITVALIVFVITLLITRIISISSLIAAVTVFVVTLLIPKGEGEPWVNLLLTGIMCAIVFIKHKENIIRLAHGQEKPIFGKDKNK